MINDHAHGTWVKVSQELPKNNTLVMTLNGKGMLGIHHYTDDEFIGMMPTDLGPVAKWCKNPDGGDMITLEPILETLE